MKGLVFIYKFPSPLGEILRVGLLLTLFQHGADRNARNYSGDTPINVVQNPDLQKFIVDYLVRPAAAEPVGAEPDYAEIPEDCDRREGERIRIYH